MSIIGNMYVKGISKPIFILNYAPFPLCQTRNAHISQLPSASLEVATTEEGKKIVKIRYRNGENYEEMVQKSNPIIPKCDRKFRQNS